MNENSPTPHFQDDEIDLKDLVKRIIKVFERGTKTILFSVLLGAILGLGYFFNSGVSFESSLVLSSKILKLPNIETLFEPIRSLLSEGNTELVSQKLQIDEEIVLKLSSLEVKSVFENETQNQEPVSYFEITATVSDNKILSELQQGIIMYLSNNDYAQRRVVLNKEKLKVLIEKVDNEINQIETLKKQIESGSVLNSASSNLVLMEPTNLYEQSLMMIEKKQEFIEELALVESIEVVKEFTPFAKPTNPSWIICLVGGLAAGLILGFAILFFREMDRYVKS